MLGEAAPRTARERFGDLSRRELEVLEMTSRGLTNPQMASDLSVTVYAIKFHLTSIYRKLGVANRTEAAVAYLTARADHRDLPETH